MLSVRIKKRLPKLGRVSVREMSGGKAGYKKTREKLNSGGNSWLVPTLGGECEGDEDEMKIKLAFD